MYAGSRTAVPYENTWVYDSSTSKMVQIPQLMIIPAVERTFMEILTNATDANSLSLAFGVPTSPIEVTMTQSDISITNTGLPIPVERAVIKNDDGVVTGYDTCYVPEQIFCRFKTGSNFEGAHKADARAETSEMKVKRLMFNSFSVGQNGVGSKLTNCYSTRFTFVVHDAERHLKYTQTCRDQMSVIEKPVIEQYDGTVSGVQISYSLDFSLFGMQPYDLASGSGGYGPEYFALFAKHCVDAAYNTRNPVSFNGVTFKADDVREFAKYYFDEGAVKRAVIHRQYPLEVAVVRDEDGIVLHAEDQRIMPELEMLVLDTPDQGSTISFVNCMATREGGEHVDDCTRAVCDDTVKKINASLLTKLNKKANLSLTEGEKRSLTITIRDVRPHISMIVSTRILYPDLGGQTKEKLTKFPYKVVLPEETMKPVSKWRLAERLKDEIDLKKKNVLSKLARKGKGTGKTEHANFAGTAKGAGKCSLYIVEGDSAKGYWNNMLKWIEGDHDYVGCLPIRGKFINSMKAEEEDILGNEEATELVKALGLEQGVDYTVPQNRAKLPYNYIVLMTDADTDGKHIDGLLLLFLYCRYPSVIAAGMVSIYRTAVLRCWIDAPHLSNDDIGEECQTFYSIAELEEWKRKQGPEGLARKWVYKYYKGLGGARDIDIEQDQAAPHYAFCLWDSRISDTMNLAFSSKESDRRKDWLAHYQRYVSPPDLQMVDMNWYRNSSLASHLLATGGVQAHEQLRAVESFRYLSVSLFMNHEFIEYGFSANTRAIPSVLDGMKESVRKIVYTSHEHWNIGSGRYTEFKVAQFSNEVANKTDYEHGEDNLHEVVMGQAQFFVGSNNLPLYRAGGQFGSRVDGGKDHPAPRYAFTDPTKVFEFIFRKEDQPILKQQISHEGKSIEPFRYYPLIPLHVVNGTQGVGYAWRSWFPNHNPLDVIDWLLKRNKGLKPSPLTPWYRGFTGNIEIKDKKKEEVKFTDGPLGKSITQGVQQLNLIDQHISDEVLEKIAENTIEGESVQDEVDAERSQIVVKFTGSFYRDKEGNPVVTELPIGRYPNQYKEFLLKKKMCTRIKNKSVGDKVDMTIIGWHKPEDISLKSLFLIKTMSLSNLVCLDSNNTPICYPTINDVMEVFYQGRIKGYYERKEYELKSIQEKISKITVKKRYAELRASGVVVLDGKNSKDLQDHLIANNIDPKLAHAPTTSSTADKIPEFAEKISKLEEKLIARAAVRPEDTYSEELQQLAKVAKKELERIDIKSKKGKASS